MLAAPLPPRRPDQPVRRRSLLLGSVLSGVLVLAGCSSAPGVVAYVGDATITQSRLETATKGVTQALGQNVNKSAVVSALITGEAARQIASQRGISISDDQRAASLSGDPAGAKLLTNADAKAVGFDLADEQILVARLGQAVYVKDLQAIKIRVNPRFGSWSPSHGLQASSGSLSQPDPNAQQTP